jgi:hypothetical protein
VTFVGFKFNPNNYWLTLSIVYLIVRNGKWTSNWTFDLSNNTAKGDVNIDVHYYEDGNVRLTTHKTFESSFEVNSYNILMKRFLQSQPLNSSKSRKLNTKHRSMRNSTTLMKSCSSISADLCLLPRPKLTGTKFPTVTYLD